MLTPRYYFADDFSQFYDYFLHQPHVKKSFYKNDILWAPNQPYEKIHYIISGSEMCYSDHESGKRKIITFHGAGTVFPGYRTKDYKIELSLITQALSDMKVLEFTIPQFRTMFESNKALAGAVINWYSTYVNRFLFETIHQEYHSSLVKICNLLYLLTANQPSNSGPIIDMTQEELADILGLSRVQFSRGLSELRAKHIISTTRGKVHIVDLPALSRMCSSETL